MTLKDRQDIARKYCLSDRLKTLHEINLLAQRIRNLAEIVVPTSDMHEVLEVDKYVADFVGGFEKKIYNSLDIPRGID